MTFGTAPGAGARSADLVSTTCLRLDSPIDEDAFNEWVGDLLARCGEDLLRMKGVLFVRGRARKLVFHSIHMQFEGTLGSEWAEPEEQRQSRVIVIGRRLSKAALQAGFERCACARVAGQPCVDPT